MDQEKSIILDRLLNLTLWNFFWSIELITKQTLYVPIENLLLYNFSEGFQFYDEFEDTEKIFRSAFGTNDRFYFWSFVNDESPRSSSRYYNNDQASWNWRQQFEHDDEDDDDEDDDDYEPEIVGTDLRKDRIALGLSGSGPLSLEDVKNA